MCKKTNPLPFPARTPTRSFLAGFSDLHPPSTPRLNNKPWFFACHLALTQVPNTGLPTCLHTAILLLRLRRTLRRVRTNLSVIFNYKQSLIFWFSFNVRAICFLNAAARHSATTECFSVARHSASNLEQVQVVDATILATAAQFRHSYFLGCRLFILNPGIT